jgi:hypothetical protein
MLQNLDQQHCVVCSSLVSQLAAAEFQRRPGEIRFRNSNRSLVRVESNYLISRLRDVLRYDSARSATDIEDARDSP